MPNYAVQNRATGEIITAYTADEPSHADIYPFGTYNHIPQPVVVDVAVREVSGVAYLRRFTQEERIAIREAASQSAVLDDYLKLLDATTRYLKGLIAETSMASICSVTAMEPTSAAMPASLSSASRSSKAASLILTMRIRLLRSICLNKRA